LEDSDERTEVNEVAWWSNWTETVWLDKNAYLLFSRDYREYFFNRGGFLKVTNRSAGIIDAMEAEFAKRGLSPSIFVQSGSLGPRLLRVFTEKGYKIADQMSVMELETPSFKTNPGLTLEMGMQGKLKQWAEVYLESFYGDTKLMLATLKTLERVSRNKEASLLLATLKEKAVGAVALFRTPGLLGVYCVGTVPEAREEHVASSLLDFASKLAKNEGRRLILQTILSESVEPFYLKLGFRRVYLKELLMR
jgi:N-acetylglutamate synthase-like GNAT family acetyltransferase